MPSRTLPGCNKIEQKIINERETRNINIHSRAGRGGVLLVYAFES